MKEYKKPTLYIAVFDSSDRLLTASGEIEAMNSAEAITKANLEARWNSTEFREIFKW